MNPSEHQSKASSDGGRHPYINGDRQRQHRGGNPKWHKRFKPHRDRQKQQAA
jgi:hypothetical protein